MLKIYTTYITVEIELPLLVLQAVVSPKYSESPGGEDTKSRSFCIPPPVQQYDTVMSKLEGCANEKETSK